MMPNELYNCIKYLSLLLFYCTKILQFFVLFDPIQQQKINSYFCITSFFTPYFLHPPDTFTWFFCVSCEIPFFSLKITCGSRFFAYLLPSFLFLLYNFERLLVHCYAKLLSFCNHLVFAC